MKEKIREKKYLKGKMTSKIGERKKEKKERKIR